MEIRKWAIIGNIIALVACGIVAIMAPLEDAGWIFLAIIICYNIGSFRMVGPTELGAIILFGEPIQNVISGLTFVPLGIMTLRKETRLVFLEQYPADPKDVWKGPEEKRPTNMFLPIRITHRGEDSTDPISQRLTAEVSIMVRFKIYDYMLFLINIGTTDDARKQVRDIVIAKTRESLSRLTPAETLAKLGEVSSGLRTQVGEMISSWGIEILDVRIEDLDLGHTVNISLRNVPTAKLEKEATITKAEGEQEKRTREGAGTANARRLLMEAEAMGYKALAEQLKMEEGEVLFAINAIKEAMSNGNQVIISGGNGLSDLIQMGKALTLINKGT